MSNFKIGDIVVRRYSSLDQSILSGTEGEILTANRGKFTVKWICSGNSVTCVESNVCFYLKKRISNETG